MKFDDIIRRIGEFGPYQKRICFLVLLPIIALAIDCMNVIFALATPKYRCSVPSLSNDTFRSQGQWHDDLVNLSMPLEDGMPSQCLMYDNHSSEASEQNRSTSECTSWVFDHSVYTVAGGEDFLLVCDRTYLRSLSRSIGYSGNLMVFFIGMVSDVIGRRRCFFLVVLLCAITGLGKAFCNEVESYTALHFTNSAGRAGIYTTGFVIVMELVGPSKRMVVGMAVAYAWSLGLLLLGGLAFGLRNWRHIQLFPAIINFLCLGMWWFIPESPRWLMSKGRNAEAKAILEKTARVNGKDMPLSELIEDSAKKPSENIFKLFTDRRMLTRTLILYFNWFMLSMGYYAISYNISNLGGNIYLNFTIGNIAELIGYVICLLLLHKVGRKRLHAGSMIIGGAACIITIFPVVYGNQSNAWVTTALSMLGRLAISCAYAVLYIYCAELFPTVVRQSAVSACSVVATVGGIVAPYIADLGVLIGGDLQLALPLVVIGTSTLAAGIMSLWLPETRGIKLPDTVQEAIDIGRSNEKATLPELEYVTKSDIVKPNFYL